MSNPTPSWIESRRQNMIVRVRADFVSAILEVNVRNGDKPRRSVRLQLGNNHHIDLDDETVDSVTNKICQATGRNMPIIDEVSEDFPGHPDYGKKAAA